MTESDHYNPRRLDGAAELEDGVELGNTNHFKCTVCDTCKTESSSLKNVQAPLHGPDDQPRHFKYLPTYFEPRRQKVAQALESKAAHITIIVLVILDLCVVLTELILSSFYPGCPDEERPDAVETAEEAFSWTSIAILSIFTIEILLKLFVFGVSYFKNWLHFLDAAIIITSLILECVLRGIAQETVSLLIIFRLWRLVRVMHAVADVQGDVEKEKLERHHEEMQQLQAELLITQQKLKECLSQRSGRQQNVETM